MVQIAFTIETQEGRESRKIDIERLIVAGWTGRDRAKMEAHASELEELGIKRPATMPTFYRVSAARLTTAGVIEVPGTTSSGEVEPILFNVGGETFVGLASDHTDREVEAYGITVSKQMCDKPCAPALWPLAEIRDHWDEMEISALIREDGTEVEYQHGNLSAMLSPADLIAKLEDIGETFTPGTAMLCGTLAAIGGVRPSDHFAMTLVDPILNRSMSHTYDVISLPIAG
jgi:hypothetical protein